MCRRAGEQEGTFQQSEAIVMQAFRVGREGWQRWDVVRGIEKMIEVYVEGLQYRRIVIDRCMDGREDRVDCEEGEQMCDVCIEVRKRRRRSSIDEQGIIEVVQSEEESIIEIADPEEGSFRVRVILENEWFISWNC